MPGLGHGLLCNSRAWDRDLAPSRASLTGKERISFEKGVGLGQRERTFQRLPWAEHVQSMTSGRRELGMGGRQRGKGGRGWLRGTLESSEGNFN